MEFLQVSIDVLFQAEHIPYYAVRGTNPRGPEGEIFDKLNTSTDISNTESLWIVFAAIRNDERNTLNQNDTQTTSHQWKDFHPSTVLVHSRLLTQVFYPIFLLNRMKFSFNLLYERDPNLSIVMELNEL